MLGLVDELSKVEIFPLFVHSLHKYLPVSPLYLHIFLPQGAFHLFTTSDRPLSLICYPGLIRQIPRFLSYEDIPLN